MRQILETVKRCKLRWNSPLLATCGAVALVIAWFNDTAGQQAASSPKLGLLDRVGALEAAPQLPLGAVIPYFGSELPYGYRWCIGNDAADFPKRDNVYPDSDWVPTHLRGQPLVERQLDFPANDN